MAKMESAGRSKFKPDKTVVRALALGGLLGGCDPAAVDVKDGKIVLVETIDLEARWPKKWANEWLGW